METVFSDIEVGEVGVVPNDDESTFYIVEVKERRPATAQELAAQRKQFLQTDMFNPQFGILPTPYNYLVSGEFQELNRKWVEQIFDQYQVEFLEPEQQESL